MDDRTWMKEGSVRSDGGKIGEGGGRLEKGEVKLKDVERVRDRQSSNLGDPASGQVTMILLKAKLLYN